MLSFGSGLPYGANKNLHQTAVRFKIFLSASSVSSDRRSINGSAGLFADLSKFSEAIYRTPAKSNHCH